MNTLEDYQKQQALDNIIGYFDCSIEQIQEKALLSYTRHEVLNAAQVLNSPQHSTFKLFSLHQVAVIFIYQELSGSSSQAYFDKTINTTQHKESIKSLIMIACEFGSAYVSLSDSGQIKQLNEALFSEVQTLKVETEDEKNIHSTQQKLFDKDNNYHIQNHLSYILDIENRYGSIEAGQKSILLKEDIYTLLILFKVHHSDQLQVMYHDILTACNIQTTPDSETFSQIKYLAQDYTTSPDKAFLARVNTFFDALIQKIKNHYFIPIDTDFIAHAFDKVKIEIRTKRWYDRLWMRKDRWMFEKNTLQLQKELHVLTQSFDAKQLQTKKFLGAFKVFSLTSVLVHEYDQYFNTIGRLSSLLEQDFNGYYEAAAMNIKNFYEESENEIEIEAINRFLLFWVQLNQKILEQKLGIKEAPSDLLV